jgi:hypothetical protein
VTDAPNLEKPNLYLEGVEMGRLEMRAAAQWYRQHVYHVERVINSANTTQGTYPPTGSLVIQPSLWRAPHWRWFFDSKR